MRETYGIVATKLQRQQRILKKYYDRSTHITKYKVGDHVAMYMPLPPSTQPNRKFKSKLRTLFVVKKIISDHNYLIEHQTTKKCKVVHHDLLRFVSAELAEKLKEGNLDETEEDQEALNNMPNEAEPRNKDNRDSQSNELVWNDDIDVVELARKNETQVSKPSVTCSHQVDRIDSEKMFLIPVSNQESQQLDWDMFFTPEQGLQQETPRRQEFPGQVEDAATTPEAIPLRRSTRDKRPPERYGESAT